MTFLQKTILCSALFFSQILLADSTSYQDPSVQNPKPHHKKSHFHAIVASGYAWSMDANIRNIDYSQWASSLEGYDASLGNSAFIMLGFGYRLFNMLDIDFDYTLYDTFYYQKNQVDDFGDRRTRSFDLNHQSSIFNFTFSPWTFGFYKTKFTPFIGMGIGVGTNQVSHFQTIFCDPTQGIGLATSIGSPHTRNSFAWQGMGGIRVHPCNSRLSLDLAYRYYNGARLKLLLGLLITME